MHRREVWTFSFYVRHVVSENNNDDESCFRSYGPDMTDQSVMDDEFHTNEVAVFVPDSPGTWSYGNWVLDPISGTEIAGTDGVLLGIRALGRDLDCLDGGA